jgi:hypothetical protein
MADGTHRPFLPERLPRNLQHDAVSIYAQKQIELHAGDRIRWTDNDHARDMLNAGLAGGRGMPEPAIRIFTRDRLALEPSLDLTAMRETVEPKAPNLPFPEKDIGLEL